ncbi:elongation factor P 5-aminopentanone reductase [Paraliobacillus zengyii]|uniref:elongation factor P 5-aminopentanone reductase n=1 Tax=Paraliobacillus zengyii TaxID=2213194 RepID=UPI000E3E756F|nr:SDR family oxidoreductase [Paraliobacillus zengyii]
MKKHCLILGASGSIGSAIAMRLVKEGYTLSLHFNQDHQSIRKMVQAFPDEVVLEVIQADLSNKEGIDMFLEKLTLSPTHIAFASGQAHYGLLQDTPSDVMDSLYHVHVKAMWKITQACLPSMIEKRNGNIIVISSIWAEMGASFEVIYSSVKGAQNSFVKAVAQEIAGTTIRINAVSPGFIDTKMNQQLTEVEKQSVIDNIPANRAGKPEEVAELVCFLFDDQKSSYINGENIKISGGW